MFQYHNVYCKLLILLYWIQTTLSMSLLNNNPIFSMHKTTANDLSDLILSKGYIPIEKELPKPAIIKNDDNDVTYLLSKLSDEELIKLLSDQPNKNEYNVKELVKITMNTKNAPPPKSFLNFEQYSNNKARFNANDISEQFKKTRFQTVPDRQSKPESDPIFRLNHKKVNPYASKDDVTQYSVVQKLNNLLFSQPSETKVETKAEDDDEDERKELLFDVLVAQLKTLCCKRSKPSKKNDKSQKRLKSLLNEVMPKLTVSKNDVPEIKASEVTVPTEHMFLILNDELKSNGNEDESLISVDPDSLGKNSSVMLLGPIATPLSDAQLKVVMLRIANELSKPEYLSLLQQIADGSLGNEHITLGNSLINGPQTRRYIKPHRCNHQSQMARVYGGPKWLLCTGYLNINTPSLYD